MGGGRETKWDLTETFNRVRLDTQDDMDENDSGDDLEECEDTVETLHKYKRKIVFTCALIPEKSITGISAGRPRILTLRGYDVPEFHAVRVSRWLRFP